MNIDILKDKFNKDGYVIFDPEIPQSILDQAVKDTTNIITVPGYISADQVSQLDGGRVQDAYLVSESIKSIAIYPTILNTIEGIYNRKVLPFQTLNFYRGTQQAVHSDAVHFNSKPPGLMCGAWVALEDVTMENGPLVYYPGTQKEPDFLMETFGLRPTIEDYGEYEKRLQEWINTKELEPFYGTMKKGEVLLWATNILHGGSEIKDKSSTRLSQVTHCYMEGCQPWRPMGGHDFNPPYIT